MHLKKRRLAIAIGAICLAFLATHLKKRLRRPQFTVTMYVTQTVDKKPKGLLNLTAGEWKRLGLMGLLQIPAIVALLVLWSGVGRVDTLAFPLSLAGPLGLFVSAFMYTSGRVRPVVYMTVLVFGMYIMAGAALGLAILKP